MTAEIVNLNKARKAKTRADKERQAEENRRKFGRTKGQRLSEEHDKSRAQRELDGMQRDPGDTPGGKDG